jgi:hypothetical protein
MYQYLHIEATSLFGPFHNDLVEGFVFAASDVVLCRVFAERLHQERGLFALSFVAAVVVHPSVYRPVY